jgi:hypothetical protein
MNIDQLIAKFKLIYGDFYVTFFRETTHTGDLEIRFKEGFPPVIILPVVNFNPDFNDISPSMDDPGWELEPNYIASIGLK